MSDLDVLNEMTQVAEVPAPRDSDENETEAKYGNIVATFDDGSEPDGLLTAKEFAAELTYQNFQNGLRGVDAMVDVQNVYNAMKGKRHPLPVVLVGESALLPQEAFEAWANRPVRGEGGSTVAASKRTDDDLLRLASEKRSAIIKMEARKARLVERLETAQKQAVAYGRQLRERFGDEGWAQVDKWESENEAHTAISDDNEEND